MEFILGKFTKNRKKRKIMIFFLLIVLWKMTLTKKKVNLDNKFNEKSKFNMISVVHHSLQDSVNDLGISDLYFDVSIISFSSFILLY